MKKKKKFLGSYEEDKVKRFRREGDREAIIAQKGMKPGVCVRVGERDRIWEIESFTKDYFVKLKGAGRPVSPHDLEVVSSG